MVYRTDKNFIKAVKFIYNNLDNVLDIECIAQEVGLSVSTLKRLFLEATGSSIGKFIRRLRMESAFRSLRNKELSVIEIALRAGFEDHSAFSRSFKNIFGYSPTDARKKTTIVHELEAVVLEEPEIVEIETFTFQGVTAQGLYFECAPHAWELLQERLDERFFNDDFTGTFIGIGHDNPHDGVVAEDKVRFSVGVVHSEKKIEGQEFVIPGGTYARFCYSGKLNNMGVAYHYIYGAWQSGSPVKIDVQKTAFMLFETFPKDFDEHAVSIYVPLA